MASIAMMTVEPHEGRHVEYRSTRDMNNGQWVYADIINELLLGSRPIACRWLAQAGAKFMTEAAGSTVQSALVCRVDGDCCAPLLAKDVDVG